MTTTRNENQFFEVRLSIYAGSNERKAFDKDALRAMGFNEVEFDAVKAVLNTDVLPKKAFHPFLAIRKNVQEFLASKGQTHPLMGRVFNPKDRVEIVNYLNEKKAEYEQAKSDFVLHYSAYIQEQLDKVTVSAETKGLDPTPIVKAVRDAQPRAEYYKRKMDFSFLDLSIELDSEQWQEVIDKINSDLKEKTIYELSRDAAEIRDMENPRTRAKKLFDLGERLKSLNFYVHGLSSVALQIEQAVKNAGDVKPAKEYSQRESLMLSGIARTLDANSNAIVNGHMGLESLIDSEAARIEALLAEEEGQTVIEEEEESEAPVQPPSEEKKDVKTESKPDSVETDFIPRPEPSSSIGAFAF